MVRTGCSSDRILGSKRNMVWQWMLQSPYSLEHKRNYELGMDALVTVFSWNTNGIMVDWML